jgi:hypothetical protein
MRAFRSVITPKQASSMASGQIAQNRVRFPNDRAGVVDDGKTAMWVHCPELRRIQAAKFSAGLDVSVIKTQLADQPHHLLEIERTAPSPDRQHEASIVVARWIEWQASPFSCSCETGMIDKDSEIPMAHKPDF